MDEYLAKISFFGFNWVPNYYKSCSGQTLQISSNSALYSLLGTNFGGDGRTTFQLPDLRGKVIMGQDSGSFRLGMYGGNTTTTLSVNHLPVHNHSANLNATTTIKVSNEAANTAIPDSRHNTLAYSSVGMIYNSSTPDIALNAGENTVAGTVDIENTGEGTPFSNLPPFLVLNPCIVVQGIYPSRQ